MPAVLWRLWTVDAKQLIVQNRTVQKGSVDTASLSGPIVIFGADDDTPVGRFCLCSREVVFRDGLVNLFGVRLGIFPGQIEIGLSQARKVLQQLRIGNAEASVGHESPDGDTRPAKAGVPATKARGLLDPSAGLGRSR